MRGGCEQEEARGRRGASTRVDIAAAAAGAPPQTLLLPPLRLPPIRLLRLLSRAGRPQRQGQRPTAAACQTAADLQRNRFRLHASRPLAYQADESLFVPESH